MEVDGPYETNNNPVFSDGTTSNFNDDPNVDELVCTITHNVSKRS